MNILSPVRDGDPAVPVSPVELTQLQFYLSFCTSLKLYLLTCIEKVDKRACEQGAGGQLLDLTGRCNTLWIKS